MNKQPKTINSATAFWRGVAMLFCGIVIGFLSAPSKKSTFGSNNGNNYYYDPKHVKNRKCDDKKGDSKQLDD